MTTNLRRRVDLIRAVAADRPAATVRREAIGRSVAAVLLTLLLASVLAACVGGPGSTGTPPGPTPIPPGPTPIPPGLTASPDSTSLPGSTGPVDSSALPPGSTATPPPAAAPPAALVTTPEEAARRVLALDSRFRGIRPYDPNLIGASAWYTVTPIGDGFRVLVRIGWGDCPSGCIDEHTWTYEVAKTGEVRTVGEVGPSVPSGVIGGAGDNPGGGSLGVSGRVTAGPTCPVMRNPPDPACADRPVAGAVLIVTDAGGREVARVTSAVNGEFSVQLPAGHYVLTPGPVPGLMGIARPVDFAIATSGPGTTFDVQYDTGIR